jgi:hypothetical protein
MTIPKAKQATIFIAKVPKGKSLMWNELIH